MESLITAEFVRNPWRDFTIGVELICITPKSICANSQWIEPILENIKNPQVEQAKRIYDLS